MVRQESWRQQAQRQGLAGAVRQDLNRRTLRTIANEIRNDWKKVNYAAVPYLQAMANLNTVQDDYGCDTAKSIVVYFLGNANSWRGETARRIKAELKGML